jgi:hypothetical protein
MKEETVIVVATPGDFADPERAVFSKLVLAGGEVGGAVLERNIANAKALVFLRRAREVQGIAALKRPQTSYRKRIGAEAGAKIAMGRFPYELGYVFLLPEAQAAARSASRVHPLPPLGGTPPRATAMSH